MDDKLKKKEKIAGRLLIGFFVLSLALLFILGDKYLPVLLIVSGIVTSLYRPIKKELIEKMNP